MLSARARSLLFATLLFGCGAPAPHGSPPPTEEPDPETPGKTGPADAKAPGSTGGNTPDAAPTPAPGADAAPADPADAGTPTADSAGPPPTEGPGGGITDGLSQLLVTRAIGLGYYHACHLLPTKDIKCYGSPATEPRVNPPAIKSDQIFCAHNGCCVLTPANQAPFIEEGVEVAPLLIRAKRLACWGHKNTFFPPANLEMDPIQIGIGYDHGCVLNTDHSVTCWGQNGTMPTPPAGLKAKSLAVAAFFQCAIAMDDSVVCWGVNPPKPPEGLKAKLVAAIFSSNLKLPDVLKGTRHACAIKMDDSLVCWGDNVEGTTDVPADLGPVKDVAVATWNTCALKVDGTPVCWGTKKYNASAERFHPMMGGLKLKGLRSKLATYCGLQLDDTMACWGDESSTHITIPAGTKFYTQP
jgi:hypothetical protein